MLRQRVVTALVLLALLLPTIFWWPAWTWAGLSLAFLTAGAREWIGLLGKPAAWPIALGLAALGLALYGWRAAAGWPDWLGFAAAGLATGWWCVAGPLRLKRHRADGGGAWLACALLLACWVALIELHARGAAVLIAALAIVWIADIAAYFTGRAIGRRKLAPAISPGKSWEGAIGGALAVVVAAWLTAALAAPGGAMSATLPARLFEMSPFLAAPVFVALAALSVVGDLHESLLKRVAGVKDSGSLLPGHGGVLDRIDALIPVMPAVSLLHRLVG